MHSYLPELALQVIVDVEESAALFTSDLPTDGGDGIVKKIPEVVASSPSICRQCERRRNGLVSTSTCRAIAAFVLLGRLIIKPKNGLFSTWRAIATFTLEF